MQRARELRPPKALLFLTHITWRRGASRRQTKYNEIVKKTPRGEAGPAARPGSNINLTGKGSYRDSVRSRVSIRDELCGQKKKPMHYLIWV